VREGKKQHTKTQPRIAQLNLISRAGTALAQQNEMKKKEIFLETIVVSSSSPGVVHILSARALLCKKRRRDNLAD
jgi:ribosomal protein S8